MAAAIVMASLSFAGATHPDVVDPNDTKGLLDVKKIVSTHGKGPKFTFRTFAKWSVDRIWDRGYGLVHLDTFGDARFDYYALLWADGYNMKGTLYRDRRKKTDYAVGSLKVWRKNKRTMIVRIPLKKMEFGESRLHYRWIVKTLMTGKECPRVCIDRIPDQGSQQVLLPGVEPSPTPTETPTVEPTPTAAPTPTDAP